MGKNVLPRIIALVLVLVWMVSITAPLTVQALHSLFVPIKEGISSNWAGYAVATDLKAPKSNAVSDVKGQWVVPSVSPSVHDSFSSVWIGIDGYSSVTVEQIGTEQDSVNGQPVYYAWFEIYPYLSQVINYPVSSGDIMTAEIKYIGKNQFQLTLNDKSIIHSDWNFSIIKHTNVTLRKSAEWIVEAPWLVSGGLQPVADFGSVEFSGAQATINGHTGTINDGAWHKDAITMVMATADATTEVQPSVLSNDGSSFGLSRMVTPPQPITVISPNGGENWVIGTTQSINWISDGIHGQVRIDLSLDGGNTWKTIVNSTPNDGNQAWKVTGPDTADARIRVVSVNNQDVYDVSDANFTIASPTITTVSPNGGENWDVGTSQPITWISEGGTGLVRIDLSRDGGSTWKTIIPSTLNDGSQSWKVTGPATAEARIRVISINNRDIFDISDADFTIAGP
jgi:hypothetical protein